MKIRSKKGFTLIEAIIAAAVLVIGVVAIIQIFPTSIKTSGESRKTTSAINLAQAAIEQTLSQEYDSIVSVAKQRVSNDQQNPNYNYWRQTTVTFVDGNLNQSQNDTGLKKIVVTVFWQDAGSEKNVTVPTLISKK